MTRARLEGLKLSGTYYTHAAPNGIEVRRIMNKRGTTLCVVSNHSEDQIDFIRRLIEYWNAGHPESPAARPRGESETRGDE